MSLPKFTSYMLSNQPDQTAYLLNKLADGAGGGKGGKLYNETGQNTDGAMTQKATTNALGTKANAVDVGNALAGKVDKEAGKGIIPLDDYLTITTDQTATGQKTFANVMKIQSGQGTGSMWIGGNVNSSNLSNNQRHLARISVPSYSNIDLGHTMLGFDSSGDSDMHVANKTYDALSFGGMKKITNASSPMAIGFCVTDTRYATAANKKIYPLELDANEARFNVMPNYNGTNLALSTDIPSLPDNLVYSDNPGAVTPATPYISSSDIIDSSVTAAKIAPGSIDNTKVDWTSVGNYFSPCVSRFMFTGSSMASDAGSLIRTTLRGTQLTFHMSNNAIYISSGADHIQKVHYSISYRHATNTGSFGATGLSPGSRLWCYYVGYVNGTATNSSASNYTDSGATYGTLFTAAGDKTSFQAEFDAIRSMSNTAEAQNNRWFLMGNLMVSGSSTAVKISTELTATDNSTVPSYFERNSTGTYYSIIIEVYEE